MTSLATMLGLVPMAIGLGDGAGAAGMYVAVGIILLIFSVGYATMSHYVTNTGAFFAFVGRGLGINLGVGSAMVSLLAYLTENCCGGEDCSDVQACPPAACGQSGPSGGKPWWPARD